MRLRFRLRHLLARVVCRIRGHRYVYARSQFGGVQVLSVRCRRCQHCEQRASLPPPRLRTLAQEVPSA